MLYGERGLLAIEVKRVSRLRGEDFKSLSLFLADYPMAKCRLVHGGTRREREGGIEACPAAEFLRELPRFLEGR